MPKNAGKVFENKWKLSMPDDVYYLRLKDSAMSFNHSELTRFTPSNPYDCLMFYDGYLFTMELKSTQITSMPIQFTKEDRAKMLKLSQIKGLENSNKYKNVFAGFVLDFRTSGNTYWLGIVDLRKYMDETTKCSLNEADILQYNGILVNRIKRGNGFRYNIHDLIERILQREKGCE